MTLSNKRRGGTKCHCSCQECQDNTHCYKNPCLGEEDYG